MLRAVLANTRSQYAALLVLAASVLLIAVGTPRTSLAIEYGMSGTLSLLTPGSGSPLREILRGGLVNANTATNPAGLSIPANIWTFAGTNFRVFPGAAVVAQLTSSFSTTHASETLMAGGGPGSFSFCPQPGNAVNPNCTNPAQATGGFNNLIQYTAGPNQFGGTFRVIRHILSGSVSRRVATNPLQFAHAGGQPYTGAFAAGATRSLSQTFPQLAGVITQSPVLGPNGSIQTAGAEVGTIAAGGPRFATGFPMTTGMIVQKDTSDVAVTWSLTGSDARTPLGSGVITLVAGSTNKQSGGTDFQRQTVLTMTLPEPGSAAAVASGVASLILLGWMRQRRNQG